LVQAANLHNFFPVNPVILSKFFNRRIRVYGNELSEPHQSGTDRPFGSLVRLCQASTLTPQFFNLKLTGDPF